MLDVIVIGGGLAGLVATHELTAAARRSPLVDQENAANLGGQAFWSFGGLFLVDTPEQRRLGSRTPSSWPGATGRAAPDSTGSTTRTSGRAMGPRLRRVRRRARSAPGCTSTASGSCRRWAGPNAATCAPPATATRCPASTSPGAPAPALSNRSSTPRCTAAAAGLVTLPSPPPRRRAGRHRRRRHRGARHRAGARRLRRAASPPTGSRSASSS